MNALGTRMHEIPLHWADGEGECLEAYGKGLLCSKQALGMRLRAAGRPPASVNLVQPREWHILWTLHSIECFDVTGASQHTYMPPCARLECGHNHAFKSH